MLIKGVELVGLPLGASRWRDAFGFGIMLPSQNVMQRDKRGFGIPEAQCIKFQSWSVVRFRRDSSNY